MRKFGTILISCLLYCGIATAQDPTSIEPAEDYSDSKVYSPSYIPDPKKKQPRKPRRLVTPTSREYSIPISVFAKADAYISEIKREEIQLFVDDSEVTDFTLEKESGPLSILLLVDRSASTEYRSIEIRTFMSSMIGFLGPEDNIWVADFDAKYRIRVRPTDTRMEALRQISKVKLGIGTALYDSVIEALDSDFAAAPGKKAIVLLSDGVDTASDKSNFEASLLTVESTDIPIYPVYMDTFEPPNKMQWRPPNIERSRSGVGFPGSNAVKGTTEAEYELGRTYLNDLVRITGSRSFEFNDLSSGNAVEQFVKSAIRPDYRIKFSVSETIPLIKRLGIRVRVKRPGLIVVSRGSFLLE